MAASRRSSVTCRVLQYADSVLAERTDLDGVGGPIVREFDGAWLHRSIYSQTVQHHGVYEYAFNNSLV